MSPAPDAGLCPNCDSRLELQSDTVSCTNTDCLVTGPVDDPDGIKFMRMRQKMRRHGLDAATQHERLRLTTWAQWLRGHDDPQTRYAGELLSLLFEHPECWPTQRQRRDACPSGE